MNKQEIKNTVNILRAFAHYHRQIGDVKLAKTVCDNNFKGGILLPFKLRSLTSNEYADSLELEAFDLEQDLK